MYQNSLKIYRLIYYLKSFWLGCMISILYLKFVGLNDPLISTFHFIIGFLTFSLEVPTGFFADKYGYKNSIILSFFFLFLFFLSFLIASIYGKWIILIFTSIFFSLSGSFESGASNSYIYKIFQKLNLKDGYIEYRSSLTKWTMIIEGLAILIGTYLYSIDERLPYFIQFLLVLIAFTLSLRLKDEPVNSNNGIISSIKTGFTEFFSKKLYLLLLVFLLLIITPIEYFHNIINQSLFLEVGFSIKSIGIIGFISYFFASYLVSLFPKLWKYLGEFKTYLFFTFILLIEFILLVYFSNKLYILVFTIILYFVKKSMSILLDYSLQLRVLDNFRATMLSIVQMFLSLPMRLLFICLTLYFAGYKYVDSFYIIGIAFTSFSLIYLFFILKFQLNLK